MPIVAEKYQFVMGVDIHAASHRLAVVDAVHGFVTLLEEFPAGGVPCWDRRSVAGGMGRSS